jgi:hypothetical protein
MVYLFGLLYMYFLKVLDIIQLIIKILSNDYVLYPRSSATVAAIKVLRDKLDAVYDITYSDILLLISINKFNQKKKNFMINKC